MLHCVIGTVMLWCLKDHENIFGNIRSVRFQNTVASHYSVHLVYFSQILKGIKKDN